MKLAKSKVAGSTLRRVHRMELPARANGTQCLLLANSVEKARLRRQLGWSRRYWVSGGIADRETPARPFESQTLLYDSCDVEPAALCLLNRAFDLRDRLGKHAQPEPLIAVLATSSSTPTHRAGKALRIASPSSSTVSAHSCRLKYRRAALIATASPTALPYPVGTDRVRLWIDHGLDIFRDLAGISEPVLAQFQLGLQQIDPRGVLPISAHRCEMSAQRESHYEFLPRLGRAEPFREFGTARIR